MSQSNMHASLARYYSKVKIPFWSTYPPLLDLRHDHQRQILPIKLQQQIPILHAEELAHGDLLAFECGQVNR